MLQLDRSMIRAVLAVLLFAIAAGCESSTGPVSLEGVRAAARGDEVEVINGRQEPIWVFVVGRYASAYTDWIPCVSGEWCAPPIEAGARRTYRFDPETQAGEREREVLVYWWPAEPGPADEAVPGRIRAMIVPIRR